MRQAYGVLVLFFGLYLSPAISLAQQATPLWQAAPAPAGRGIVPKAGRWFTLDKAQLAARLAQAPPESRPTEAVVLELPYPDGSLHEFALTQVPVLAPGLAARYPNLLAYAGHALDEPATSVRLEWAPTGLHAQVTAVAGSLTIEADPSGTGQYQSHVETLPEFSCQALPVPGQSEQRLLGGTPPMPPAAYGAQLRLMRIALSATGEYVQKLGGGTKTGTLASMVTLVNSLNAVYERELSMRLQIADNTDLLIYPDAATDPFTSTSPSGLLETNRTLVSTILNAGTYELGHVLGYISGGYSGVAYVGVTCNATYKSGGASTASSASSMLAVTTHEIGHQLGSNHTFNGDKGNCSGGNRSPDLAYEPGAGNTIMSYDRRCAPDDVGAGINYFHAGSLSAIMSRLASCGSFSATGNQPPSVSVPTTSYAIPMGTPFSLAGSGTDANGDALVYSWEELDRGDATGLAGAATDASGPPLFRSFAPVASPERTFPQLASILSNTASVGEILPLVPRSLNFRLTARDNRGGVAAANMSLTVADAGPFVVTAPAATFTAKPGSAYTVTWNVLGTNQTPVNCTSVQVLFSADGGLTFPTVLLASTPNTGSAIIQLPNLKTTRGRLKVQAVGNVFFAINNANLTLDGPLPVELATFTAEARGMATYLAWTTASENNNRGFAVEASTDGTVFTQVAWLAGHGTSTTPNAYRYTDAALPTYGAPQVYYRLRQLDTDGTESFSPVLAVKVPDGGKQTSLQVLPNPTQGQITVSGLAAGQPIQLLDLTGRVLLPAAMPTSGPLRLTLPAGLTSGVYILRGGSHNRRVVVE